MMEKSKTRRSRNSRNSIERAIKILQYLKWNTNKQNKLAQKDLRKAQELEGCIGDKKTFNNTINNIANTVNADLDGHLFVDDRDWRLMVDGLLIDIDEDDGFEDKEPVNRMGKFCYNHRFSHVDMDAIINGIWSLKTIDSQKAKELSNMLALIQDAISRNNQISFSFNSWQMDKNSKKLSLRPIGTYKYDLSLYYIVVNSGKYYLLGCNESEKYEPVMSIWRVDLMSEVEIRKKAVTPKEKVGNRAGKEEDISYTFFMIGLEVTSHIWKKTMKDIMAIL